MGKKNLLNRLANKKMIQLREGVLGSCIPIVMLAKGSGVVRKRGVVLGNEEQGTLSFSGVGYM